jgi:pimeloyl-ACP methyl ester carboxylesterase
VKEMDEEVSTGADVVAASFGASVSDDFVLKTSTQINKLDQRLTLSDGRTLSYAEFGPSTGRPVIYFHGTPGSRLQAPGRDALFKQNIRLIAFDRPGYGNSTAIGARALTATAQDVQALADHLGLETFGCLGVSGGAPYAAAVAQELGPRVTKLVLANPQGNPTAKGATKGMGLYNKFAYWMMNHIPFIGRLLVAFEAWMLKRGEKSLDSFIKQMPKEDQAVLADPAVRKHFVDSSLTEGMKQGSAGHKYDNWSYVEHFDVTPRSIRTPTHIFAGEKDANVSSAMVDQWSQIPGSKTTSFAGEGHMSFLTHWGELLSAAVV